MDELKFESRVAGLYDEVVDRGYHDQGAYLSALSRIISPGESLIELGCGTGSIAIPLSRQGVHVDGLDSSQEMLDVLRRKDPEFPIFLCDARVFAPPKKYDYALSCSGPVTVKGNEIESYFLDAQQVRASLIKWSGWTKNGVLLNKGVSKDRLEIELDGGRIFRHREMRDGSYMLMHNLLYIGDDAEILFQIKRRYPLDESLRGAKVTNHDHFVLVKF